MLFEIDRKLFHHYGYIFITVITKLSSIILLLPLAATFLGCSSSALLPSQKEIVVTPWNSYEEATKAFDKVIPYQTKKCELGELGFEPRVTSNIKILNYLDIMERFMPNQAITLKDLADGLQDCLADQEQCHAYEIIVRKFDSQRFGNVLLDLFNFRRKTTVTGWEFIALIVIKNDLVVYKLSSGVPMTDEFRDTKNPLGPLQNSDKIIWAAPH